MKAKATTQISPRGVSAASPDSPAPTTKPAEEARKVTTARDIAEGHGMSEMIDWDMFPDPRKRPGIFNRRCDF